MPCDFTLFKVSNSLAGEPLMVLLEWFTLVHNVTSVFQHIYQQNYLGHVQH